MKINCSNERPIAKKTWQWQIRERSLTNFKIKTIFINEIMLNALAQGRGWRAWYKLNEIDASQTASWVSPVAQFSSHAHSMFRKLNNVDFPPMSGLLEKVLLGERSSIKKNSAIMHIGLSATQVSFLEIHFKIADKLSDFRQNVT